MKKFIFAATLMLFSIFCANNLFANSAITVISSDANKLIISAEIQLISWDTIKIEGKEFYKANVMYSNSSNSTFGQPNIPIFLETVIVPSAKGAYISSIKAFEVEKINTDISPIPKYTADSTIYSFDPSIYNSYKAEEFASLKYSGYSGFEQISRLEINPILYNPNDRSLQIPKKIIIEISFEKSINKNSEKNSYLNFALNSNMSGYWSAGVNSLLKIKNDNKTLSSSSVLKLSIDREGIYKLTASDLSSNGINVNASNLAKLKIFGFNSSIMAQNVPSKIEDYFHQIPVKVNVNGSGDFESLVFYATGAQGLCVNNNAISSFMNPYTKTNSYILSVDGEDGLRATEKGADTGAVVNSPDYYTTAIYAEEDIYNAYEIGSGLTWFGRQFDQYNPLTLTNTLPNLKKSGNIQYNFYLAKSSVNDIITFELKENGNYVDQFQLSNPSVQLGNKAMSYSASNIASDNRSFLSVSLKCNNPSSIGYLDKYIISYPSELRPNNNELALYTNKDNEGVTEYSINGFNSSEIYCFDISKNDSISLIKNNSNIGSMFSLKTNLKKNELNKYYISSNLLSPRIEKIELADLRNKEYKAKAIIIAHPDLLNSANEYKAFREENDGIEVDVISTNDIFNEFGFGVSDPSAIRNFASYAFNASKGVFRYLILWGDGHYDYRNLQTQKTNYIIPFEVETSGLNEMYSYPTDDYYACIYGEDSSPDVAFGRITINSDKEGLNYVNKLIDYAKNSSDDQWRSTFALIADDDWNNSAQPDGSYFTTSSETIANTFIDNDILLKKLYMIEYPIEFVAGGRRKPLATQQFISLINNDGAAVINWVGHGNPRVLAHEELFNRDKTLQEFNNRKKMFFFVGATCDFARYDDYGIQSGAENMLTYDMGGAIGIYAADRSVYGTDNDEMLKEFYKQFFVRDSKTNEYLRIGDIVTATKSKLNTYAHRKFVLLCDPMLKLTYPDNKVKIDSINGYATDEQRKYS